MANFQILLLASLVIFLSMIKSPGMNDYNLQRQSNIDLLHFPSSQIIRKWNQNHISLKSEAEVETFKEDFIKKKLNSYDEECSKQNCHACRNKTWSLLQNSITNFLPNFFPKFLPNFLPNFRPALSQLSPNFLPTFTQLSPQLSPPQLKPPMSTH